MPKTLREVIGEVTVFDGTNAAELAEVCGIDPAPPANADGSVTLLVPLPFGGHHETTLYPGDGLVSRPDGYLPIEAEALAAFKEELAR